MADGSKGLKASAAILFSLGSIFLLIEMTILVIIDGRKLTSGLLIPTGWTAIGILGMAGWIAGIVLLGIWRLRTAQLKKDRKNVFLAGRTAFTCGSCARTIDASHVGYHERVQCPCGAIHNVFQDIDEEKGKKVL